MKKLIAVGASAALMEGMAVRRQKLQEGRAPSSVAARQMLTMKWPVSKARAGGQAFIREKGATVSAKPTVSNGDHTIRRISDSPP